MLFKKDHPAAVAALEKYDQAVVDTASCVILRVVTLMETHHSFHILVGTGDVAECIEFVLTRTFEKKGHCKISREGGYLFVWTEPEVSQGDR